MNHQDSSIYLFLRSIYKFVYHLFSGETEIERIARRQDTVALEYSLTRSRVLANFRIQHCNWQQTYTDDIINELCELKGIGNNDAKFRVTVIFKELYCWKHAIKQLQQLRLTKYDSTCQDHETKLLEIWERLRPLRQLKSRKSVEWIELGFQADDPATDFRGTGLLGLLTLHQWVGKNEGKQSFRVADTKGTDYFFASASIFLAMLAFQIVRDRLIPASYWVNKSDEQILPAFQRIYEQVFREFNNFWSRAQDKSMMQFNTNLIGFSKQMKQILVNGLYNKIRQND